MDINTKNSLFLLNLNIDEPHYEYFKHIREFMDIYFSNIPNYKKAFKIIINDNAFGYRYFCYHYLKSYKKELKPFKISSEKEAVLIIFDEYPHVELILRNTINKLSNEWSHTIFCCLNNYEFIKKMVAGIHCKNNELNDNNCSSNNELNNNGLNNNGSGNNELNDNNGFNNNEINNGLNNNGSIQNNIKIICYNGYIKTFMDQRKLMLSENFWNSLLGEKILLYDEQSMVLKSNIDDFLQYDFIGAPWKAEVNPKCVGNGSFSIRSKNVMLDIISKFIPRETEYSNITEIMDHILLHPDYYPPEDVYFTTNMIKHNIGNIPDSNIAKTFSVESIFYDDPFGFHECYIANKDNWRNFMYDKIVDKTDSYNFDVDAWNETFCDDDMLVKPKSKNIFHNFCIFNGFTTLKTNDENDIKKYFTASKFVLNNCLKDSELNNNELKDSELQNNCLKDNELKNSELQNNCLKDNELKNSELKDNKLQNNCLEDSELQHDELQNNCLEDSELKDNELQYNELQNNELQNNCLEDNELKNNELIDICVKNYSLIDICLKNYNLINNLPENSINNDFDHDNIKNDNLIDICAKNYNFISNCVKNHDIENTLQTKNNDENTLQTKNNDKNTLLPETNNKNTSLPKIDNKIIPKPTIGFIITRHISSKKTNYYWVFSYINIRKYYPKNLIVVIDDHSNTKYLTENPLTYDNEDTYKALLKNVTLNNLIIINSTLTNCCGELLPYYYFNKYKFFDKAVILHDSMFVNKYINFEEDEFDNMFIFNFHSGDEFKNHEDTDGEQFLLKQLTNHNYLLELHMGHTWKGCFGACTSITHDFLVMLESKYNLSNLVNFVKTRFDRCKMERVIAVLFFAENYEKLKIKPSICGSIVEHHRPFEFTFDELMNGDDSCKDYKIIKVWSGR